MPNAGERIQRAKRQREGYIVSRIKREGRYVTLHAQVPDFNALERLQKRGEVHYDKAIGGYILTGREDECRRTWEHFNHHGHHNRLNVFWNASTRAATLRTCRLCREGVPSEYTKAHDAAFT
jgi:hypothetical protein